MFGSVLLFLTFASALGCGLAAGVFFAFSTFVMKALGRLPPAAAIAAMQAINVAAINPWFMSALFGTAASCAVLGISALLSPTPGAAWRLGGSALYLAGTVLVTVVCNVPRNNVLAALDPGGPDAAAAWSQFLAGWTVWNHVRAVSALLAAASLTVALLS
jgi:uncharacterized membrane protein